MEGLRGVTLPTPRIQVLIFYGVLYHMLHHLKGNEELFSIHHYVCIFVVMDCGILCYYVITCSHCFVSCTCSGTFESVSIYCTCMLRINVHLLHFISVYMYTVVPCI